MRLSIYKFLLLSIFVVAHIHADWKLPPLPVKTGVDFATAKVCCNNDGTAMAFWLEPSIEGSLIGTSYFDGIKWVDKQRISTGEVTEYQIACTQEGKIFVIWRRFIPSPFKAFIEVNVFNGTTWSGPTELQSTDGVNILSLTSPQICCDIMGNAMAVWVTQIPPIGPFFGTTISFSHFDGQSLSWTSADTIPGSIFDSTHPDISCNALGNTMAIWTVNQQIYAAEYINSAPPPKWNPIQLVSDGDSGILSSSVCYNDQGHACAVWLNQTTTRVGASYFNGSNWSTVFTVLSDANANNFDLCCTENLDITVIWNTFDGKIQATRFNAASIPDTGSALPFFPIDTLDTVLSPNDEFFQPSVCCSGSNKDLAVWRKHNIPTDASQIFGSNYDGSWSLPPTALSDVAQNMTEPSLCCIANGNGIAVWAIGGNNSIVDSAFFTSFIPPPPPIPPLPPATFTGARFCNRFATQSADFALLQWTASPSIGISSYRIYRNGVLIATLSPTTLNFKDCLIPCGRITYTIVSVAAGVESVSDILCL